MRSPPRSWNRCAVESRNSFSWTINQSPKPVLYMDCGCCRGQGLTAVETLFQPWVDNGMVVCLDMSHWFNEAICTVTLQVHCVQVCAGWGSDGLQPCGPGAAHQGRQSQGPGNAKVHVKEDAGCRYISRAQLKHHVWRVTLGVQETFWLLHLAAEELKCPPGLEWHDNTWYKGLHTK